MKKTLLITLTAALATTTAWAMPVTSSTALEQAREFVKQGSKASSASSLSSDNTSNMKVVYTGPNNTFYVISKGQNRGYIIVAGDDCARTILGYSNSGNFNLSNMPKNQRDWIMQYASQVALAAQSGVTSTRSGESTTTREVIKQYLNTKWDQNEPYNSLLQEYTTADGYKKTVSTGCVATALAQIMNYHEWPVKAVGKSYATLHYDCADLSKVDTMQYTFGETTYDWSNMIDYYTDEYGRQIDYTDAQKKAVAELMRDCGYAVKMNYNDSGDGASGASSYNAALALVDNFGYDLSAHVECADWYTANQWEELVYNQLKEYGPVLYCGGTPNSGHAFVCDGYDENGLFHINWGWNGSSDNYFALTALQGGRDLYNLTNEIVANVRKPTAGSSSVRYPGRLAYDYSITFAKDKNGMPFCYTGIQNVGMKPITFTPAFCLTNKKNADDVHTYYAYEETTLAPGEILSYLSVENLGPAELPAGEYTLELVYQDTAGTWYTIQGNNRMVTQVDVTVPQTKQEDWSLNTTVPYAVVRASATTPDSLLIGEDNAIQLDVRSNAGISNNKRTFKVELYTEGVNGEKEVHATATSEPILFNYTNSEKTVNFTLPLSSTLPTGWAILQITDEDGMVLVTKDIKCVKSSSTGISNVTEAVATTAETTAIYTIDGTCLNTRDASTLSPGIYLQKTSDGTTRKILVK